MWIQVVSAGMFSYTIRRKTLQVSLPLMKKQNKISLKTYSDPEINMKGSGRVEYVFVGVNEEIEMTCYKVAIDGVNGAYRHHGT